VVYYQKFAILILEKCILFSESKKAISNLCFRSTELYVNLIL